MSDPKHALNENTPVTDVTTPVEEQREELADTVAALAEKLDVSTRVSDAAKEQTDKVAAVAHDGIETVKQNPQTAGISLAGAVAAVVVVLLVRRRRARKNQPLPVLVARKKGLLA